MIKKVNYKIFAVVLPLFLVLFCWGIGLFFGGKNCVIGPYYMKTSNAPFWFIVPDVIADDDIIHSYETVRVYEQVKNFDILDFLKKSKSEAEMREMFRSIKFYFKKTIPLSNLERIVNNTPHLRQEEFKKRVLLYKCVAILEKRLKSINFFWINILGWILLISLLFSRSGFLLFMGWWWLACLFASEYGLMGFWRGVREWPWEIIFQQFLGFIGRVHFKEVNTWYSFLLLFFVVIPCLMVLMGVIYFFKHIVPKRKREIEDFVKYDKDKKKRSDLSIETVKFKKVKFSIKKKFNKYKRRDKYFLGVDDVKKDVFIRKDMMNKHIHILGPTGSGKTSMAVLPLSLQCLEKGRGVCIVDFKGDEILKKSLQKQAETKGKKFYYFSIDPQEASSWYNPLFSGDIYSKVDRIMSALELIYKGPAGFYSNVQSKAFMEVLKIMIKEEKEINFRNVIEELEDLDVLSDIKADEREVKGLLSVLARLAEFDIINNSGIDLEEIIKNEDVVFFALKSQVNTQLAEAIGRMLIIDLKFQAVKRTETDKNFFIFVDEFQTIASEHFIDVISKVRSANFCLVLSNQSRGNLKAVSPSFENTVFTNTATKIIFTQEDPDDARFWAEKTGRTRYEERGMRMFSGKTFGGEETMLDGKREVESSIGVRIKNLISENLFLRLPQGKSIVFLRQKNARLVNHAHFYSIEERDLLLNEAFLYKDPTKIKEKKNENECNREKETSKKEGGTDVYVGKVC